MDNGTEISKASLTNRLYRDYSVENTWDTIFTIKGDTVLCKLESLDINYKPIHFKLSYAAPTRSVPHKDISKIYSRLSGVYENVSKGDGNYLLNVLLKGEISLYYLRETVTIPLMIYKFDPPLLSSLKFKRLFIKRGDMVQDLSLPFSSKILVPFIMDYPKLESELKNNEEPLDFVDVERIVREFNKWYYSQ